LLELNGLIWHGAQLQLGEPSQCPVREYMSISGPPLQVAASHATIKSAFDAMPSTKVTGHTCGHVGNEDVEESQAF
jgi:hypothetical protein